MVEEILENLIGQFSDPLTFYRELIQNSLDAGARLIEVSISPRHEPPSLVIDVRDWGEGMNHRIITDELTRLFASTKEEDFTKIGKFGIGFVSVFAIQPDMVAVDTGRDGESWRIVFDGSATYQCLRLEEPFEGARVRVYKNLPTADHDDFVARSLASIRYWCRYSDTPIHFNSQAINSELNVDSPVVVRHQQPGTEVVLGLQHQTPTPYGLYNRGLTLVEGVDAFWPGVSFRLSSRYLEHTLTRDSVMRDANYEKAVKILRAVASHELPRALMASVRDKVEAGDAAAVDIIFKEAVPYLAAWRQTMPGKLRNSPLFPTVHGDMMSVNQLRRAAAREGALYIESSPNHVTQALKKVDVPVLLGPLGGGLAEAAAAVAGYAPAQASLMVVAPQVLDDAARHLARLVPLLRGLLHDGKVEFSHAALADFNYPGSNIGHLPCLMQPDMNQPVRLHRKPAWWQWLNSSRLLVNRSHPLVQQVLARSSDAPLLSAFVLAKAFVMQDGGAWAALRGHAPYTAPAASDAAAVPPEWLEARWMARTMDSRPRLEESWLDALKRLARRQEPV